MIRTFNGGTLRALSIHKIQIDGFRLFLCYKFEVWVFSEECNLFFKVGTLIDPKLKSLNVSLPLQDLQKANILSCYHRGFLKYIGSLCQTVWQKQLKMLVLSAYVFLHMKNNPKLFWSSEMYSKVIPGFSNSFMWKKCNGKSFAAVISFSRFACFTKVSIKKVWQITLIYIPWLLWKPYKCVQYINGSYTL